jgi:sorbitol/mannitol transport system permease protein
MTAVAKSRISASKRRVNTLPLLSPAVLVLLLWMIVPLAMTLWFSFQRYNLLNPSITGFAGFDNYTNLLTDSTLWTAMMNTLVLVVSVLAVTVVFGTLLAVLFDRSSLAAPSPGCSS